LKALKQETLHYKQATPSDSDLYFEWANDELVRSNSYESNLINPQEHDAWFNSKLKSGSCFFYLFLNEAEEPVGQVRIDKMHGEEGYNIGISIDKEHRGRSYSTTMLEMATTDFLHNFKSATIVAFIKTENQVSYKTFKQAGFTNEEIITIKNSKSYKMYKSL
jgi:RimJ/RimL family protein N-acetyltransferase